MDSKIAFLQEFGIKLSLVKFFEKVTRRNGKLHSLAGKIKYNLYTNYLYSENKDIIERNLEEEKEQGSDFLPIWIFWYQGFDKAPELVKICVNSVMKYRKNRTVNLIDISNYKQFVDLNPRYEEMVNKGQISKTQFSDILRLNILYQQGGVWLDSTCFLSGPLPEFADKSSFFTVRHGMSDKWPMSKGLWTSSALASSKQNPLMKVLVDVYDNYYSAHDLLLDYVLTDYIMATVCDHNTGAERIFYSVPVNNVRINELARHLNDPIDNDILSLLKEQHIHKLSYKIKITSSETGVYEYIKNCSLIDS